MVLVGDDDATIRGASDMMSIHDGYSMVDFLVLHLVLGYSAYPAV